MDIETKSSVWQEPGQAVQVDVEYPQSVLSSYPENREVRILAL